MNLENLPLAGLLDGQTALVTGGARGIGKAIALHLAGAGAQVAVADLNLAGAEQTAAEVRALGRASLAAGGDLRRAADREAAAAQTERELGPIDILINGAGIVHVVDMLEVSEADWDRVMDVNAKALFFLSQRVLRGMAARGRGAIVSLASLAGKTATQPNCLAYNVSKAAVIAMTKTLAAGVAKRGVRVNCVCPGMVDTEMWVQFDHDLGQELLGLDKDELRRREIETIPLGRAATVDDVARVALFLASPLAGYMTGQAINVTGGLVTF